VADIEARLGRKEAAVAALEQAARHAPQEADLQIRLSQAQAQAGRPAEALLAINRAIELAGENAELLRARAQLATWAGDYPMAFDSYRRLLELVPTDDAAQLDLARAQDNPPQTSHALDQAKKVSSNLNHAISQLLSLARNDPNASQSLHMEAFDLALLARQVTMDWAGSANSQGIDLGFESDGIPSTIHGDPTRIKELLDNLLDNALRYCPWGSQVTSA
jgi:signal transduction histidine kinase